MSPVLSSAKARGRVVTACFLITTSSPLATRDATDSEELRTGTVKATFGDPGISPTAKSRSHAFHFKFVQGFSSLKVNMNTPERVGFAGFGFVVKSSGRTLPSAGSAKQQVRVSPSSR